MSYVFDRSKPFGRFCHGITAIFPGHRAANLAVFPIHNVTIARRGRETNHGGKERWVKWFLFMGFDGENIF